jgi:hypothetical protein
MGVVGVIIAIGSRVYRLDVWKNDAGRKPDDYQQGLTDWYRGEVKTTVDPNTLSAKVYISSTE